MFWSSFVLIYNSKYPINSFKETAFSRKTIANFNRLKSCKRVKPLLGCYQQNMPPANKIMAPIVNMQNMPPVSIIMAPIVNMQNMPPANKIMAPIVNMQIMPLANKIMAPIVNMQIMPPANKSWHQ